ncbi:MAG: helix-turn-helix transcriptional regulator [Ktedonobacteraceae bacterium]
MQQEQQEKPQRKERDFQEILRRERAERGWSQADVVRKIGSDLKTVGRWERGISFPGPYMCQQLSALYGKSMQELRLLRDEATSSANGRVESEQERSPTPVEGVVIRAAVSWEVWRGRRVFLSLSLLLLLLLFIDIGVQWSFHRSISAPVVTPAPGNPYASRGVLALNEMLATNSAAGWSLNQNEQGQCFFADGTYRIRDVQAGFMEVCLANETYFTNFTYEVTMTIEAGDCGGLAFRTTFPQLYYFLSCLDGSYRLVRYDKDNAANRRIIAAGIWPLPIIGTGSRNRKLDKWAISTIETIRGSATDQ